MPPGVPVRGALSSSKYFLVSACNHAEFLEIGPGVAMFIIASRCQISTADCTLLTSDSVGAEDLGMLVYEGLREG